MEREREEKRVADYLLTAVVVLLAVGVSAVVFVIWFGRCLLVGGREESGEEERWCAVGVGCRQDCWLEGR